MKSTSENSNKIQMKDVSITPIEPYNYNSLSSKSSNLKNESNEKIILTENSDEKNSRDSSQKDGLKLIEWNHGTEDKNAEEYKIQLAELERKIELLKDEMKELTLKNSALEEKVKVYENLENYEKTHQQKIDENQNKILELTFLLKEARKQNIFYSDQIKELNKRHLNFDELEKEKCYLQNENKTLKAFIVSQNNATHYKNAFKNLQVEKYCPSCSKDIVNDCSERKDLHNSEKDVIFPASNKTTTAEHKEVVETLKNSSLYTMKLSDKADTEGKFKKETSQNETLPKINKASMKKLSDLCDLPFNAIDETSRNVFHIGDQILIRIAWDADQIVKATTKYIGGLGDQYSHRLYIGARLHMASTDIPKQYQSDGRFKNRLYFTLDKAVGYFLHVSDVVAIYCKERGEYEEFGQLLQKAIDPSINRRETKRIHRFKKLEKEM